MNLLISGSRDWNNEDKIKTEISKYPDAFIIVGDCRGADSQTIKVVKELGERYQIKVFKADWAQYGKSAGPRRNSEMLDYLQDKCNHPKKVLVFHSDLENSKGSKHVFVSATKRGFDVEVIK